MEIYAVNLNTSLDYNNYIKLLLLTPDEKQVKIKRYLKFEDAQRSLVAEILVRYIIQNKLGIRNRDIVVAKNQFGKPYLVNVDNFHFNISHSGNWVVCAIDDFSIGIDIERIQAVDLSIAKRFFSEEEYIDLLEKPVSCRTSYFFELWTLKESYIKADGRGLYLALNKFAFRVYDNGILFKNLESQEKYFFNQYDIDTGYKMAVCAKKNSFAERPCVYSLDGLKQLVLNS